MTAKQLAAHLRRDLEALGLKRVSKELDPLKGYIRQKYGNKTESDQEPENSGDDT